MGDEAEPGIGGREWDDLNDTADDQEDVDGIVVATVCSL